MRERYFTQRQSEASQHLREEYISHITDLCSAVLSQEQLKIEKVISKECDRKSQHGDKLKMHYRGRLESTGVEFDSSFKRNTPFEFRFGAGEVIRGWDEGLQDMCPGDKRVLTIPPSYGYGSRGVGGVIPGGATLIFDVELVDIVKINGRREF